MCKIIIDFYSNFIRKMGGVMGTGTLVHSLGSMNLSPMIPYLIFNKDSIFSRNHLIDAYFEVWRLFFLHLSKEFQSLQSAR